MGEEWREVPRSRFKTPALSRILYERVRFKSQEKNRKIRNTEVTGDLSALKPEDVSLSTLNPTLTAEVAESDPEYYEVQNGFGAQWIHFGYKI